MRANTAITVALVVAAVAAVPVAGLAGTGDQVLADQHGNSSVDGNASVAPGERLSGVVGIQGAELEGEVDGRAFGLQVARAAGNEARADVVAAQFENVERRLVELEQRKRAIDEAHANGSMSEGEYRARVAELAARTETAKDLVNRSENATRGLPADLLDGKGINVTAIQTLKDRAENMTGPEVAEIARSIAGPDAAPVTAGPDERSGQGDGRQGPPDDRPGQDGDDAATPDATPDDGQQDGSDSTGDTPTATPTPDDGGGGDGGPGGSNAGDDDRGSGESPGR